MDESVQRRLKKSRGPTETFEIENDRELIIFRLKLWNRSESPLFDWVLRVYDDSDELFTAYPMGMNFKSRRLRGEAEVFTPYKNAIQIPAYIKSIRFAVEPLKPSSANGLKTDFEVKFDLF
jgi:hypothetical protein